mmetsp:Transcript_6760/g.12510  ORF Transcript_6760/g.12510 Transcript_6760/m.12510 type:complete len:601 (-) Transcript_6760:229-2031(-)
MTILFPLIGLLLHKSLALISPPNPVRRVHSQSNFARHQLHRVPLLPSKSSNFPYSTSSNRPKSNHVISPSFFSESNSARDETSDISVADSHEETPLTVAIAVGITTSFIGYAYSKLMKAGFRFFWKTLPSAIFEKSTGGGPLHSLRSLLIRYPQAYIVLLMTFGAFTVGTLSTCYFPDMFSAHGYVEVLSQEGANSDGENKMDKFPGARGVLIPVLIMSCLTSVTGFSLGPEAPMVCAGGLAGVSLARKYNEYMSIKSKSNAAKSTNSLEETLAYAGAAGTLTGFMNIPLAGPIFALEMTCRDAGISSGAARSWTAAMAASLAGMVFVRGGFDAASNLGGHFTYASKAGVGVLNGIEMVLAGLGCGVGGALVGTLFHKTVRFLKSVLWPATTSPCPPRSKYMPILKQTLVGFLIGLLSIKFPQTMFWGEGSLQCAVDGQCTAFASTPHGIPSIMTQSAHVDPNLPFSSHNSPITAALQVGVAKFLAIAIATSVKLPGGVIFPLLSNGASFANALVSAVTSVIPVASSSLLVPTIIMSFMAATLTSITRTPLATVLILALTSSSWTNLSAILPGALLASYVSVWVSNFLSKESYFNYSDSI